MYLSAVSKSLSSAASSALSYAQDKQYEVSEQCLSSAIRYLNKHSHFLAMITPHESIHELNTQLTDASTSLAIRDLDDFKKAISIFLESIEHLKEHEQISLSNIL